MQNGQTMKMNLPLAAAVLLAGIPTAGTGAENPTFSREVSRILQRNCQNCHRPGEAAPFSLLTYAEARPWAKAMREAVLLKKDAALVCRPALRKVFQQPFAGSERHRHAGGLGGCRGAGRRSEGSSGAGAVCRKAGRSPSPMWFTSCRILIRSRRRGTIEYQKVVVPTGFTEDKWVQFAEARPDDRGARSPHDRSTSGSPVRTG